jgi:MYXO-CTERM domain-containing protein
MRKNAMTKCAVGAMLFGGTLGMSQAASAGLVFNLNGPSINGPTAGTFNTAYTYISPVNYEYEQAFNSSFAATTFTLSTGLSASWTATSDSTGFATTVLASATQGLTSYVETNRSFTVTGTQQITLNWSGSTNLLLGKYNGGTYNDQNSWSSPITPATGWTVGYWGSSNGSSIGTLTTTLSAGTYWLSNTLSNQQGASFSFTVVPAPGALALLGVAGIVGARRRRA